MKAPVAKLLEEKLKKLGYRQIAEGLKDIGVDILLQLLDCRSIKIGNTAADFLSRKGANSLVISAITKNEIKTKIGKIRAQSILFGFGREKPEAMAAYLQLLQDRNDEVAYNSLLALVAWGDGRVIPAIKERQATVKSKEDAKGFLLACEAIEKSDMSIFSPHFSIDKNVW